MTKLKKYMLILTLGAGFGLSLNAWARPGCDSCNYIYTQCQAGDATQCANFTRLGCDWYSGNACAIF